MEKVAATISVSLERRVLETPSKEALDLTYDQVLLTSSHEAYLIARHGTTESEPLPSEDPNDPLNWPNWQKNYHIALTAFMTFSSTFMAAGIATAFETMAEEYGTSVHLLSYLTSAQICAFGFLPLFWVPLMLCVGRKWILAGSMFCCMVLNIGGGFAKTYGQQMATRALVGVFILTSTASGGGVVHDLSFASQRGTKNGWWSLGLILGTPGGPFVCGFIQKHAGTKWVYFTFAIMNAIQFALCVFSRETLRHPKVLNPKVFVAPLKQAKNFYITLAVVAALMTFAYNNVCLVVLKPTSMAAFKLDPQELGLNYLSLIIGLVIGEILAGWVSDKWMAHCIAKRGGKKVAGDRLWNGYFGFALCILGLFLWGAFLDQAGSKWNIKPLIGDGIAAAGNNVVATVLTSYAIDILPTDALDIALYLNLVRSTWAFLAPFYLPDMFESLKYLGSAGLMNGLVFVFGVCVMALAHWMGRNRAAVVEKV